MGMAVELRKKWNEFVAAFNALGAETRGMTPTAASLLLVTALEYTKDNAKGYQPIKAGVPGLALFSEDGLTVDISRDYYGCPEFWDVDVNNCRAKITKAGVDYVEAHLNDVFMILANKR